MKKIIILSGFLLLTCLAFNANAQIFASNVKLYIRSGIHATANAEIRIEMYNNQGTYLPASPAAIFYSLTTNVEHSIGTLYFPNAPMWTPPGQPQYWCRIVGGAQSGSDQSGGVGGWGSPDGTTYTFDGGVIKITLPN